jgi:hypothetical protein
MRMKARVVVGQVGVLDIMKLIASVASAGSFFVANAASTAPIICAFDLPASAISLHSITTAAPCAPHRTLSHSRRV